MEHELIEIKDFQQIVSILDYASKEDHKNSSNYDLNVFSKRWFRYQKFYGIVDHVMGGIIALSGIYDYGNNCSRICDRTWIHPFYRNQYLGEKNKIKLRPTLDYFVPVQTEWCIEHNITPFISIQHPFKDIVLKRIIRETNYDYKILDGIYFTCLHENKDNMRCWQRVISTGPLPLDNRPI